MHIQLDDFDKQILAKLEEDGRIAFSQIADDLGISNTMVHKRYEKLVKHKIISKMQPSYDARTLGYGYSAFTGILLEKESKSEKVIEALKGIPEVTECYFIAGPYTLYIRIYAKDQDDLRRILYDTIDQIEGVSKTESMIDLGCAFKRNIRF